MNIMPAEVHQKKSQEAKTDPSICSCEVCDSIDCFVKRNQNILRCTCGKCSETCIVFLPEQNKLKETTKKTSKNINSNSYSKDIINTKVVLDKNLDIISSETSKYSSRKFFGSNKSSTVGCANQIIKNNMCYDNQPINNQTTSIPENSTHCVQNVIVDKVEKINSTAKLSAQIMNVPYSEFENSMSFQKRNIESKSKVSKFDILDRIKKAYEACSCKLCECIPSIPIVRYERCDCKPCECNDCRKIHQHFSSCEQNEPILLTHNLVCNKRDQSNKYNVCKKISVPRSTPIIVAPVGESTQRGECTCNPCDCMECDHPYGTINTSGTHEMSTGISRHINCRCEACLNEACDTEATENCRCEGRDRLMRKPVEKDTNDYDIRSAFICKTKSLVQNSIDNNCTKNSFINNSKNLINTSYHNLVTNPSNKIRVCVNSKEVKKRILPLTSQDFHDISQILKRSELLREKCACKPCECEFCSMKSTKEMCARNSVTTRFCKERDCWHCKAKLSESYENNETSCDCGKCECINCDKLMTRTKKEVCDCENCKRERGLEKFKKAKAKNCIFVNQSRQTDKESIENEHNLLKKSMKHCALCKSVESFATNTSKYENMSYQTYRLHNKISCFDSKLQKEIQVKMKKYMLTKGEDTSLAELKNGFKCDTFVQCRNGGKIRYVNKFIEVHKSDSFVSAVSSKTSKGSFINISSSTLQNSKNNTKCSVQSSCNSSGHDHSDYLILFPRTTVGTCIKDVMNLDLNSNINLENINISNKPVKEFNPVFKKSGHYLLKPVNKPFHKEDIKMLCSKISEIGKCQPLMRRSCKHNCPEKICDCNSCDCENCSFSRIKQSSCQCNCLACNCCGVCLNENQSILIKKNEGVQTPTKKYQDKSEGCIDCRYNVAENYGIETQIFPLVKRRNYNMFGQNKQLIPLDNTWPVNRLYDNPYKYFPLNYYDIKHVHIETNVDFAFPLQDNYKSLHNTLKEARAFSSELLKILEKYEKANKEFDSLAQKLKENGKGGFHRSTAATSAHKIILIEAGTSNDFVDLDERAATNENSNQTDKQNTYNSDKLKSDTDENLCGKYNKDDDTIIEDKVPLDLNSISSFILEEVCKKLSLDKKNEEFRNRYLKYRKLIKRAVRVANRFKANSPVKIHSPVLGMYTTHLKRSADEHIDVNNDGDFQKAEDFFLQEVKGNISLKEPEKIPKDDLIVKHIRDIMLGKKKSPLDTIVQDVLEIRNQVYKINDENVFRVHLKGLKHSPVFASEITYPDDDEVKCGNSVDSTPLPQKRVDLKYASSSNELLHPENLNLLIPNPVKRCKESSDNMKITFERVERVSDHTILIRWHPPLVTEAIQGYELLVDGRAVQTLLGPSRSMAVVTCVPHTAKILLTIRTITSNFENNYPSASIIYRPR